GLLGQPLEAERDIERLPKQSGGSGTATMARELSPAPDHCDPPARAMEDAYVSTEHLLVGLVGTKGTSARAALSQRGIDAGELTQALAAVRGSHRVTGGEP